MNSLVEARVKHYLRDCLNYDPYQCGAIMFSMRHSARVAGHALDHRFAGAGLSAGPDARVASCIVDRAACGGSGGDPVGMHDQTLTLDRWIRTAPPMGM